MTPQQLIQLGYSPLPIVPYEKCPSIPDWVNADSNTLIFPDGYSIGNRCGDNDLTALDIDIYDSSIVDKVRSFTTVLIGEHCERVGMAPKTLIPVICHGLTGKIFSKRFRNPTDETVNAIEILTHGNQFVTEGIHPQTLQPYTWSAPLPHVSALPVITRDLIDTIFQYFDSLANEAGWIEIVTPPKRDGKKQTPDEFHYNQANRVENILVGYGWTQVGDSNQYIRPGKTNGIGLTVTENVAYCFTSSSLLEPDQNHRPYDIVLAYSFNGDRAAMKAHADEALLASTMKAFGGEVKSPVAPAVTPTTTETVLTPKVVSNNGGYPYLTAEHQVNYFDSCIYIADVNKVLIPNGSMLDQARFNVMFGGVMFELDANGNKTAADPWKAFTNGTALQFPKVDHTCFRPDLSHGSIITDDISHTSVNTYVPAIVPSVPGNVTRFTNHIERMIPNPHDRAILLAYMAACVQYIGVKFQWCPLIQGVQGNGKTLISSCIEMAIGSRYVHQPNPEDIDNKFNDWLFGKLLIVIEEVNVKGKYGLMDVLKPMITAMNIEIQGKGIDKITKRICCNFVMNSNFKDALIKTVGDRRHSIFYCAQQEKSDLARDGMDGNYFPELWDWLRNGGYAAVTHYLQNYDIPAELNPAGACHRAPDTSSTAEAISLSKSDAAQIVEEAVNEHVQGFMGGWISSMAISKLFKQTGTKKSYKHRKHMMDELGYIQHPGLPDGRTSKGSLLDGGRTRLYVKPDSLQAQLRGVNVMEAYLKAQGAGTPEMTVGDGKVVKI